jgi:hypothetical protein
VPSSARRLVGVVSLACALGLVGAATTLVSSAQAALLNLSPCNSSTLSRPFFPWADPSAYELAPGGDFESPVWSADGGARLVSGGEPYGASGSARTALLLPAGASAQSPTTCVDAAYPTIRFFIAGTGSVAVEVIADGLVIPSGIAVATGHWAPTTIMVTGAAVVGTLSGGTASVSLRLIALSGDPRVDDVYIDPWNRG